MVTGAEDIRPYLYAFDLRGLLVEGLGWNHDLAAPVHIEADGNRYSLERVAEKSGFVVYVCSPGADGKIPESPVRRKIERQAAKLTFEHLIIFGNAARTEQCWQWVRRERGKPAVSREQWFRSGETGERLLQRLGDLAFDLEEEAGLSIAVVASRVQKAMDVEKVTKRFYERFKEELSAFQDFIDGITEQGDQQWYASLMLNRMMFVYFIQKQGFLDGDPDYLRNRLGRLQSEGEAGRFQQFYRIFLLRLFHEGFGQPEADRAPDLVELLGKVPFLNGGLFDVHDLERDNPGISIPDEAFERVFAFFDSYQWHLDERPRRADNEINPDVLGYIFEKYINQKQMGAYYTKEDITGYISRNTVIPFLFDAARKECPVAFVPGGGVWRLLQDDPDRYIYPSLAHGLAWSYAPDAESKRLEGPLALPDEIAVGVEDVSERGGWNKAAPSEHALPTETWREVVARRQRYAEIRAKLVAGGVSEINELITLNLDVEQFAADVIGQSEGPELLRAFWHAIRDISVLDPTCGSGAFLFAALNILEPLYTACLEGMRSFLDDLHRSERPHHPRTMSDFREVLRQVEEHPSERYFILKSIVLNNLYGVDIMEEAVEICKLRLFLKLVAQLETYDQIEPLPDIDFNIRAGNTLIGFTSLDAVRESMRSTPDGQGRALFDVELTMLEFFEDAARDASSLFDRFREQQTVYGGEVTPADKASLRQHLENLGEDLSRYLAIEYGAVPWGSEVYDEEAWESDGYREWRESHQPFHWFAEFYGITDKGGFDVVIGNPPYVARKKVAESYTTKGFDTADCPDIYAMVVERSIDVCREGGRVGMIVPLSLTFSREFASLRTAMYEGCGANWYSSFGRIPSALFSFDTRVRNTIYIGQKSSRLTPVCFTTRLHRWFGSQRPTLFEDLSYTPFLPGAFEGLVPKIGSTRLLEGIQGLLEGGAYRFQDDLSPTRDGYELHFKQTAYNWLTFCIERPPAFGPDDSPIPQTEYGAVRFGTREDRDLAMLMASGKLMFLWWAAVGDDFHLTQTAFKRSPLGPGQIAPERQNPLLALLPELQSAMAQNVEFKLNAGKNIGNYNLARCREVTDKVDKLWLEAVGLEDLWEEIELEHSLVVRTSFEGG